MNTTERTTQGIMPQDHVTRLRLAMVRALNTTVDDLHYLQKTIQGLLEQEYTNEVRQALEQKMIQAQNEEMLARQEIEALIRRIGD